MITIALAALSMADGVKTTFVPTGATAKAGGYRPIRSDMKAEKPASVKKIPDGLASPRFGSMKVLDAEVGYILAGDKVFVDSNLNGNYTDDPAVKWESQRNGAVWTGSATAKIKGKNLGINFYHFGESDPSRAQLKDTMLYYGDYGYEVTITLDGKTSTSFVQGSIDKNTSLSIDRNGDGKTSYYKEMVQVGKPFNFTGTTYVLEATKNGLKLSKSEKEVEMTPLPPELGVGKDVLTFKAKSMAGVDVDFPTTYKGKLVLLDFWATWCGPCLQEMPNVVKAYNKYHDKGFEILGVSFDDVNAVDKIKDTTSKFGMTWDHVYEGKGWNTTLGQQFDVAAIPFTLLVDGSTGKILAQGDALRGDGLDKFLAAKLGS